MSEVPLRAPVTVVVLTCNEERNIARCLTSVAPWVERVVVVDSGSTDRTLEIARGLGAEVLTHPFETHSRQWKWALESITIATPWILAIDADQRVSDELRPSIIDALSQEDREAGRPVAYFLNRRQIFRGRWIRHGGYYPKYLLKLFRAGAAVTDETDLVDHHFRVAGPVAYLSGDLIEDNQNEARIYDWIAKHNHYARRQAREECEFRDKDAARARLWGDPDERTLWLKAVWRRLPRFVRPFVYFFYRYVVRLGFLDGKEGFTFHFMQALWYRLLVDINIDEIDRDERVDRRTAAATPAAPTGMQSTPGVGRKS